MGGKQTGIRALNGSHYKAAESGRVESVHGGVMKILAVQRAEPALEEIVHEGNKDQSVVQAAHCDATAFTGLSSVRGRQFCYSCELPALLLAG